MPSFLNKFWPSLSAHKKVWLPPLLLVSAAIIGRLVLPVASPSGPPAATPSEAPADAVEVRDVFGSADAFPRAVETPAQPWAYGAQFKITGYDLAGPVWIRVNVKVKAGPVGIGVVKADGNEFLSRVEVDRQGDSTVTLPVAKGEDIGSLVIQSWDKPNAGNVVVAAVTVLAPSSAISRRTASPAAPASDAPADAVEVRGVFGSADAFPKAVETPAQPWAYGAQFKATGYDLAGPVWIRVNVKVNTGPIGIGVLKPDGIEFLSRVEVDRQGDSTVTLPVAKGEHIGSLVVQTWDKPTPGNVVVEAVTVLAKQSSASQPR